MADIEIEGGKYGINIGNQQFTLRNINISKAQIGIYQIWNWGFTYSGLQISDCGTAFSMVNGYDGKALLIGSVVIIDSKISNCPIFMDSVSLNGAYHDISRMANPREDLEYNHEPYRRWPAHAREHRAGQRAHRCYRLWLHTTSGGHYDYWSLGPRQQVLSKWPREVSGMDRHCWSTPRTSRPGQVLLKVEATVREPQRWRLHQRS